jgi:DNA ligase-1
MRQGANEGVVADAVAKAAGVATADVRRATMLLGDLGLAAQRALAGRSLDVGLTPLVAVQPMLAATSATAGDAVRSTGPASVEWKLDGIRVQAHKQGDVVRLFTRGLNEITQSLPNVAAAVRAVPADDVVLDGESLALSEDGRPRRFQDTMSGLDATDVFFFDALYLDGRSLIDEPLAMRKRLLAQTVPSGLLLPSVDTADPDEADRFATGAVDAGHEGVVVKALDSPYQAGRRGATWRKVKPVHTLDLVVIAAEWGHGRRTGWLSNLHLGARAEDGAYVMVGKTFKGMTDELLRWQTAELQARAIATEGITVHVRPELVVEIALDGVQVSRRYPGGVALRFARVRRYRADKSPSEADTIERVQAML